MSKELFVSSTPHETRVALVEDGQVSEVHYERENEYTLAGSIYLGRVTRVLPGMQSAFVDIGLERDAFLYVSDFFELEDEEEGIEPVPVGRAQIAPHRPDQVPAFETQEHEAEQHAPQSRREEADSETSGSTPFVLEGGSEGEEEQQQAAAEGEPQERGPQTWNKRRRRRRGHGFPESKFAHSPSQQKPERPHEPEARSPEREYRAPANYQPMILPGESISKYQRAAVQPPAVSENLPAPAPAEDEQPAASRDLHATPEEQAEREHRSAQHESKTPEQERMQDMNVAAVFGGEARLSAPESENAEERPHSSDADSETGASEQEPWRAHAAESARRTLQIFNHPEQQQEKAEDHHFVEAEQQHQFENEDSLVGPATSPESPFLAAPFGGNIEEEEIEEEEVDLPEVSEHFEEMDFEELEEETFEPEYANGQALAAGGDLTSAVEEAQEDREIIESAFEQENGEETETAEPEDGRAEVRSQPATAPFQQRTERRFDRRGRGRRGGRRVHTSRQPQRPAVMISDVLKEGQEVLIQIAKEPIGKKGARITSHIALPGRFLVYMPTVNHTGVSRKIASEEERQRLKRIVMAERENGHGGFIVRTAAEGVREQELRADIRFLKNLWAEIKQRSENSKPPSLIYHDLNLVERTLRDLVTEEFSHIWVDNEQEYERVLRFVNRFQPALVRRVRLYTKEAPLYEQFGIQEEINKALKSKVWLKSGGYIVINQTEALVAIDVNTGKYVGKTQRLEDTIVKTNIDAIREIVRQVRLRDLGGIIVVDFIDMDERKNRQKVMQALEEVGSSRVDLQACKLEYSIVSPK